MGNVIQEIKFPMTNFLVDERLVWIDIRGLSLGVWSDRVSTLVAPFWGQVVCVEGEGEGL